MAQAVATSAAFVRNGRTDVVAGNPLARALLAPMFNSPTIDQRGRPNIARYVFLDLGAHDFFVDWDAAGNATAALLRAEAGREPRDRALRELVGELSSRSPEFRSRWAAHEVLIRHDGVKRLQHPDVGHLELTFQDLDLPLSGRAVHNLITYTAEPGTASEDRLKLLASWAATQSRTAGPTRHSPQSGSFRSVVVRPAGNPGAELDLPAERGSHQQVPWSRAKATRSASVHTASASAWVSRPSMTCCATSSRSFHRQAPSSMTISSP
ncbi:hypothetical protein IFM12275_07900 [Nocardia sputorum]|nr:hypothetical protein IFM12275_07900 [Nocardia sputorum]